MPIHNADIARLFEEIADLLDIIELKGCLAKGRRAVK